MSEIYYNASNFVVDNGFIRNPKRYYLEEYFLQKPGVKGDLELTNTYNEAKSEAAILANKNFEVAGTNMDTAGSTFDASIPGVKISTQGTADENQAIIQPHTVNNQSAWNQDYWSTDKELEWECAISIPSETTDIKVWAGLKLTNDQLIATDANQAFFKFQTDADHSETFTTFSNLHFIYSIADDDYVTDLGITVEAGTVYRLKIVINKTREVSVFVNEKQYGLTQTPNVSGNTQSDANKKSLALTASIPLKPYIGIETGTTTAKSLNVIYQKISRVI